LNAPVEYIADDSMEYDIKNKKIYHYVTYFLFFNRTISSRRAADAISQETPPFKKGCFFFFYIKIEHENK